MEGMSYKCGKVNGSFCPMSITSKISETFQQGEYLNLHNGERIEKNEVMEWGLEACNDIIEKYGFNENQGKIFKNTITINYNNTKIGLRGSSRYDGTRITDDGVLRLPNCIISLNPNLIENKKFYKAILIHEIDHWAFRLKKFFNSKLGHTNPSNRHEREIAANEYNNMLNSDAYKFSTELLARVDTSDILASKNREYSRDEIDKFGIGNEDETTGEPHYSESIIYARKFLNFQKGLYNLLGKTFGLDSNKDENKQLPEAADKQFQTIMNRLRNEIFNSPSIERSKKVIDDSYRKLQESRGYWNTFCSLRK